MTTTYPTRSEVERLLPYLTPPEKERLDSLLRARPSTEDHAAELARCASDPLHWLARYCVTYDPRLLPAEPNVRFVPFPRQADLFRWLQEREARREGGLVEKSRDTGATYCCAAYALHGWLFRPGFACGFGSRKLELVDKIGDPSSIFEKIRIMLRGLPDWMIPPGFRWSEHDNQARLINPANGASIVGEGGDNIGRGARTTLYFVDEAQPLDAGVLTPAGWRRMGDLAVGDQVIGGDGKPCNVVGVNDAGRHPVYRFWFSDGTTAECSPHHLWTVEKVWGGRGRITLRAEEIAATFRYQSPGGQTQYRYRLPRCPAVQFAPADPLPLHPYLLGTLIGDGSLGGCCVRFTSADEEVVERVRACVPTGCTVVKEARYDHRIVHAGGRGGRQAGRSLPLLDGLTDLGLKGSRAADKFVPRPYLLASADDRLRLLRGLMDTDGSASGGRVTFHTSSPQLARDVLFLVRSLGGLATHTIRPDWRGYKDQYQVYVSMPTGVVPFSLSRKSAAMVARRNQFEKAIVGVELRPAEEVRCISVDRPDGLYITDGFSLTHNSAFVERPSSIDRSLSATTDVRIDVSTPNGPGNPFAAKRHSGKLPVFTLRWQDDPRKGPDWYAKQQSTLDAVTLAQEYDIDYSASVEGITIPALWVRAAVDLPLRASGPVTAGLDIAAGGSNRSVFIPRQGPVVGRPVDWGQLLVTQTARRALEEARQARAAVLNYDSVGVGEGVRAAFTEALDLPCRVVAINSGSPASERRWPDGKTAHEKFINLRAEMWRSLRLRFEKAYEYRLWLAGDPDGKEHPHEEMISIPNDERLIADLSLPLSFETEGGKIKLESKADMARRGVKSPDFGDALALTELPVPPAGTYAAGGQRTMGQGYVVR